ncbi:MULTISPECIES: hypothetical protein [unclassified Stenotrophomonas]|nr:MULTISPECIES: hypothetical protein [unclassified Stenotrophomonas]
MAARFNATMSAFAVVDYTWDMESGRQKVRWAFEGNVGLRLDF